MQDNCTGEIAEGLRQQLADVAGTFPVRYLRNRRCGPDPARVDCMTARSR
jgi:hypothetical protein